MYIVAIVKVWAINFTMFTNNCLPPWIYSSWERSFSLALCSSRSKKLLYPTQKSIYWCSYIIFLLVVSVEKAFTIEHSLTSWCNWCYSWPTYSVSQICSNIQIKPQLQSFSSETLSHHTSNADDHAILDIHICQRIYRYLLMWGFSTP